MTVFSLPGTNASHRIDAGLPHFGVAGPVRRSFSLFAGQGMLSPTRVPHMCPRAT